MSAPKAIFIDTSIYEAIKFDFESPTMSALISEIKEQEITLLCPAPINDEIVRHIREHSVSAINSLKSIGKEKAFLRRLKNWPLNEKFHNELKEELEQATNTSYQEFRQYFKVVDLGYEGVSVETIMQWYDQKSPPFSEGKKSEFPDAFAVEILKLYAREKQSSIAVISKDADFKAVCDTSPELRYYTTLSEYIQSVLEEEAEDRKIEAILDAVTVERHNIEALINKEFSDSEFTIEANWDGEVDNPHITHFGWTMHSFVSFEDSIATINFEAEIQYEADVDYDDLESATYDGGIAYPHHRIQGTAEEETVISGTLRVKLKQDGDTFTVQGIEDCQLDTNSFTICEDAYY